MLYIIGLGLIPGHITQESISLLKQTEEIYVENYTSCYSSGSVSQLEEQTGKKFTPLNRAEVEEKFNEILEKAKDKKIAFCVYGNPMNATTHIQIILDAKKNNVKTKTIPGISVFEYVSFSGLERYKFGRTTSIVFHEENFEPESFYDAILENKKTGLHTLCLLDIKAEEKKMMNINHALNLLESIELKREKNIISESIFVALTGLGSKNQQIIAGTSEKLKKIPFSEYPQSLIICGKLNEKELEALKLLSDFNE